MTIDVTLTQIDIREFINAGRLVLSIALVMIFAWFVVAKMREHDWYRQLSVQAAVALSVLLTGDVVSRLWGVVLLYQLSHGGDGWATEQQIPLSLAGWGLALVGALCAVRVFTPSAVGRRLREWVWVIVGVLSVIAGTVIVYL